MGQLTQDDLLAAAERAVPDEYIAPIKAFGDGYEFWQGAAKIGERCSLAVQRLEDDGYVMTSAGGALASVVVVFYRPTNAAGAGRVIAGTIVRCSVGGQVFRTTTDAVFTAELEMSASAVAIGFGYEFNVKGKFVDPSGVTWPGEIDTIDLPLMSPPFFDETIQVRNDVAASGGRPATLDALGDERDLGRRAGEADVDYRRRISSLPDTVAPNAITRQLTAYFRPFNLNWAAVETWQHEYQECYDAPADPPTAYQNYDSNLFCYDDPRDPTPMQNRYLGENDVRGAGIVDVARPPTVSMFGFAWDDDAVTEVDLKSTLGIRAWGAYDVPDTIAPPSLPPAWDGLDFGWMKIFTDLFDILDQIKLGGVYVVITIQGSY